jgi:hypothetical protein
MWDEPYLETCCRSALHRLSLSGEVGRAAETKDGQCLMRLTRLGLAALRSDSRYSMTQAGAELHSRLVQRRKKG